MDSDKLDLVVREGDHLPLIQNFNRVSRRVVIGCKLVLRLRKGNFMVGQPSLESR
jgi:hypothetical protein